MLKNNSLDALFVNIKSDLKDFVLLLKLIFFDFDVSEIQDILS